MSLSLGPRARHTRGVLANQTSVQGFGCWNPGGLQAESQGASRAASKAVSLPNKSHKKETKLSVASLSNGPYSEYKENRQLHS